MQSLRVADNARPLLPETGSPSILFMICVFLILVPTVYLVVVIWYRDRALKKLPGTYAPIVPSTLPFGE